MRIRDLGKRLDNPALGLDLLRTYLGIALLVRGATFLERPEALGSYIASYMDRAHWGLPVLLSHYIVAAHIAGGILLVLGLGTRLVALVQVPILIGAVFFVHWGEGLLARGQSLELSALVLVMLLVIGTFGPGEFSLDHYLEKNAPEETAPEADALATTTLTATHGEHEATAH